MSQLRIMLADLKHFNKYSQHEIYIPLHLGYLVSHINKTFGAEIDAKIYGYDPHQFLDAVISTKPHIVGLSVYAWNRYLVKIMIQLIRKKLGAEVVIVVGGPSIDTDEDEQRRMFERLKGIDLMVPGDGEIALANIVKSILSNPDTWDKKPIDGAVFLNGDMLVKGKDVSSSLNLKDLDSPYLSGLLDEFLSAPYKPVLQTSRGCPNRCTYCVFGKNKSKIRKFPVEQVKAEVDYHASCFCKRPHNDLHIVDNNFGLFPTDLEIANHILKTSTETGYPLHVGFYNDKNFTKTTKELSQKLKNLKDYYCLSLQTTNSKSLKAIKRENINISKLSKAVDWVKKEKLKAMTELIFGLPHDTKEYFIALLDESVDIGFDFISTNPLLMLDGAELNRRESRKEFGFKTKYRLFMNNYGIIDDAFTAEAEEIVVASDSFTFDDFISIRYLAFMFYAIYMLRFQHWFFYELRKIGVPITQFFDIFFHPDADEDWPEGYIRFIKDLKNAISDELYDSEAELIQNIESKYRHNGCKVFPPTKINTVFAARLIYQEKEWHSSVLKRILLKFEKQIDVEKHSKSVDVLLNFFDSQVVDPRHSMDYPRPIETNYDLNAWVKDKFAVSLQKYKMNNPAKIDFYLKASASKRIDAFVAENDTLNDMDFDCFAIDLLRRDMFYSFNQSQLS